MKKVIVKLNLDGSVNFDYNGFQGDACLSDFEEVLRTLESLGIDVGDRETKKKRDFYVRVGGSIKTR